MRLNGWMRIAIVLSAVWWVGGSAYFWMKEIARQNDSFVALYMARSECIGLNGVRRAMQQPERTCLTEDAVNSAHAKNDLWLSLIPSTFWLIMAWVGIGITYVAVRWIRKGFVKST
jgi:hypothetical protein